MKIRSLEKIRNPFFTSAMAVGALGVQRASANLACHRYVKSGLLLRLKRDLYVCQRLCKNTPLWRLNFTPLELMLNHGFNEERFSQAV